jgi:Pyruvate/2-oxoacid:ferredoxin oxidoreductase delta subunit
LTEALDRDSYNKYKKVAQVINSAGGTPYPITDTLVSIVQILVPEDDLDFIIAFEKQKSQTIEQLKASSNLSEEVILEKVEKLAKKGLIFNLPNRYGVMVFKLMPFVDVGVFEYTFMKKLEYTDDEKELADLYAKVKRELRDRWISNYDKVESYLEKMQPIDRTIPFTENKETGKEINIVINKELEVPDQKLVPTQKVEELVEKFDEIAVGHCFCRHHKDLLGNACKQTDIRENCFTFGKSARYTFEQGFSRMISKDEALKILKQAEHDGLVHKAYHPNFDIKRNETSICNCCTCCCGNFGNPTVNASNYFAQVNQDLCVGCGTCVEKCSTSSMQLNEDVKAERIGKYCIGCGVCAYFCPENAISLVEDKRIVRILPPRPT